MNFRWVDLVAMSKLTQSMCFYSLRVSSLLYRQDLEVRPGIWECGWAVGRTLVFYVDAQLYLKKPSLISFEMLHIK